MLPRESWTILPLSWQKENNPEVKFDLVSDGLESCPKSQVKPLTTTPAFPSGVQAFQLAGKKGIFVPHNSKKPLWALSPPSLCVVSVLKPCRSVPEFGPLWIDHYAGCSETHTASYMWGRIVSKGRNACLAAFPSLRVSADFFFFFFCLCLCHLIFKPGFDLLCLCKSGESLRTDIKWARACFSMLLLLSTCLDILQQMAAGILMAHLYLPSYPPSRSAGASIRCLFSRQSAETGQWWRKETAKKPCYLYTIFMLSPTLPIYNVSCFCN